MSKMVSRAPVVDVHYKRLDSSSQLPQRGVGNYALARLVEKSFYQIVEPGEIYWLGDVGSKT